MLFLGVALNYSLFSSTNLGPPRFLLSCFDSYRLEFPRPEPRVVFTFSVFDPEERFCLHLI